MHGRMLSVALTFRHLYHTVLHHISYGFRRIVAADGVVVGGEWVVEHYRVIDLNPAAGTPWKRAFQDFSWKLTLFDVISAFDTSAYRHARRHVNVETLTESVGRNQNYNYRITET